jgi:hypothetical protein
VRTAHAASIDRRKLASRCACNYLGRTCTGWIAPACGWRTHSITSSASAPVSGCPQQWLKARRAVVYNTRRGELPTKSTLHVG